MPINIGTTATAAGRPDRHRDGAIVLAVNVVTRAHAKGDVDQQHARGGQKAADEAAAGKIVPAEKHEQRKRHNHGVREPGRRLQQHRSHLDPP